MSTDHSCWRRAHYDREYADVIARYWNRAQLAARGDIEHSANHACRSDRDLLAIAGRRRRAGESLPNLGGGNTDVRSDPDQCERSMTRSQLLRVVVVRLILPEEVLDKYARMNAFIMAFIGRVR